MMDAHGAAEPRRAAGALVLRSDAEWRASLTPEQFLILRERMTEPAFTGDYWSTTTPGVYECAACGAPLYASEQKVDAGTGWPCFTAPVAPWVVTRRLDHSGPVTRVELVCGRCEGHLGHLGIDHSTYTGERHHVNSAALRLRPAD